MQNNGFVRTIIHYQSVMGDFWTKVIQRLYELEFPSSIINTKKKRKGENTENQVDLNKITIVFPMPLYMNIVNTNEQISNVSQTIDFISNAYLPDDVDTEDKNKSKVKAEFKLKLAKDMLQTLDWETYDKYLDDVKASVKEETISKSNDVSTKAAKEEMNGGGDLGF